MKTLSEIKSLLLPLAKINRTTGEETLDSAFANTKSSHDAVFVFGNNEQFLGLISPSYAFFKRRYPPTTKVKSCMITPPYITKQTPQPQIAEFMLSTGIYNLPVFEAAKIIGVINAKSLIKHTIDQTETIAHITRAIKPEKPVTAPSNSTLVKIYELLRQKRVSRVLLVGKTGRLEGIVARRDIQSVFTKPDRKYKSKTGGRSQGRNFAFGLEKESLLDLPLARFMKRNVLTADARLEKEKIIQTFIHSDKNSIVLLDGENHPRGIISTRTLLEGIAGLKSELEIPIVSNNNANLPQADVDFVASLIKKLAKKLYRRSPIVRVESSIKESKNMAGRPNEFEITIHFLFHSGKTVLSHAKGRNLQQTAREALQRISQQIDKQII